MTLTFTERWILSNQYRILAALHPEYKEDYEMQARALESGYAGAYTWDVHIDEHELTAAECSETLDILTMFSALTYSYESLEDKSGIDPRAIEYQGFDGNNDKQYGFAMFLRDQGKFGDLNLNLNSHSQFTLNRYRAMLQAFNESKDRVDLTKEDIQRIAAAGRSK